MENVEALRRLVVATSATGLVALTGACATKPPTAEEEVTVWLSEAPRTLVVKTARDLPTPTVRVRDHKPAERAGRGAVGAAGGAVVGAGYSILAGCMAGPFGCVVGLAVAPVAAVVGGVAGGVGGAVSVKSIDVHHALSDAKGAPELYAAAVDGDRMAALITEALVAAAAKKERHVLRAIHGAEGDAKAEIRLTVRAIDLAGDVSEDPSASLVLEVRADISTPESNANQWATVVYQGRWQSISQWSANDAALFRAELVNAAEAIAARLVEQLDSSPPMGAASRVAAERQRRVERAREAEAAAAAARLIAASAPPPTAVATPAMAAPVARTVLRSGASWSYKLQDKLYNRAERFTVELRGAEGSILVESFSADGKGGALERVDPASVRFTGRSLAPGHTVYELAPYLFTDKQADRSSHVGTPTEYPLGGSTEPWRLRVSPVTLEQVTVAAGSFNALRLEVNGERGHSGFAGLAGGAWSPLGVTRFRFTAWYVPEVKRYVMSRHQQWNPSGAQTADEVVELERYRLQ